MQSHPSWVRGLKYTHFYTNTVTISVAPFVGAWIEIIAILLYFPKLLMSHPSWVRGLKYA